MQIQRLRRFIITRTHVLYGVFRSLDQIWCRILHPLQKTLNNTHNKSLTKPCNHTTPFNESTTYTTTLAFFHVNTSVCWIAWWRQSPHHKTTPSCASFVALQPPTPTHSPTYNMSQRVQHQPCIDVSHFVQMSTRTRLTLCSVNLVRLDIRTKWRTRREQGWNCTDWVTPQGWSLKSSQTTHTDSHFKYFLQRTFLSPRHRFLSTTHNYPLPFRYVHWLIMSHF